MLALAAHVPRFARAHDLPLRLARDDAVALTFDDGPHPDGTPAALEALGDARATFFLVGEQVERFPGVAAQIADAGHEVALHCHEHTLLPRRSARAVAADLARAAAAIEDATGQSPRFHRAPYGVYSRRALAVVRPRWDPILWSRWGRDWERRATPESIARRAARDLRGGDVVLLHDADWYSAQMSWRSTVAAIASILARARERGLGLCALSQAT